MPHERIALDAMGGDDAPRATLRGALRACRRGEQGAPGLAPERVLLVGDEALLRRELERLGGDPGFAFRHASQSIAMDESPAQALRAKPDSSIAVAVAAVLERGAGAIASMGHTGAVVGATTLGLGTLPGVKRPGIAVTLELTGRPLTLIDMGANTAPKPEHLCQYGVMGAIYMRDCLGVAQPRVGLLNIGSEASKGTDLLKAAHPLLAASGLSFVGNVESGDVFLDKADVVVTDGFTGNVVLKLLEGYSSFLLELVVRELAENGALRESGRDTALQRVRQRIDYSEYGGALLLGVAGIVIKGHGRSDETAVANALRVAARALDRRVNEHIVQGLSASAVDG